MSIGNDTVAGVQVFSCKEKCQIHEWQLRINRVKPEPIQNSISHCETQKSPNWMDILHKRAKCSLLQTHSQEQHPPDLTKQQKTIRTESNVSRSLLVPNAVFISDVTLCKVTKQSHTAQPHYNSTITTVTGTRVNWTWDSDVSLFNLCFLFHPTSPTHCVKISSAGITHNYQIGLGRGWKSATRIHYTEKRRDRMGLQCILPALVSHTMHGSG